MSILKDLGLMVVLAAITFASTAQVEINKSTKKYEFKNEELLTVDRAAAGELINRFYYWGKEEFKDMKHTVSRDDSTFRTVDFVVTMPLPENHFGVKFTHKKRELTFRLQFDAEKKEYSYIISDMAYKALEIDRKGRESSYDGVMEEYKGAAKRALIEELDMVYGVIADSFAMAADRDLTEAQMTEYKTWQDEMKSSAAERAKAAAKAKKEAAAAAKKAQKEEAAAAKAAAKEAAAAAKKEAADKKAAEAEAAKKAREAESNTEK